MTRDEALLLISEIHARGSISTLEANGLRSALMQEQPVTGRAISHVSELAETFGSRVRAAREGLGWSQSQLSRVVGITQPAIRKIEEGETRQTKYAIPIAQALGIPRESIVSFCEAPDELS